MRNRSWITYAIVTPILIVVIIAVWFTANKVKETNTFNAIHKEESGKLITDVMDRYRELEEYMEVLGISKDNQDIIKENMLATEIYTNKRVVKPTETSREWEVTVNYFDLEKFLKDVVKMRPQRDELDKNPDKLEEYNNKIGDLVKNSEYRTTEKVAFRVNKSSGSWEVEHNGARTLLMGRYDKITGNTNKPKDNNDTDSILNEVESQYNRLNRDSEIIFYPEPERIELPDPNQPFEEREYKWENPTDNDWDEPETHKYDSPDDFTIEKR